MTNQELAAKLRCISTVHTDDPGCESCPFWIKEPVLEDLREDYPDDFFSQCDCDRVNIESADALENSGTHVMALQQEIERLRGQLERQWISVEERLPETTYDVMVLVSGILGNVTFENTQMIGSIVDDGEWFVNEYPRWDNPGVTHWMHLPEPPKEAEQALKEAKEDG